MARAKGYKSSPKRKVDRNASNRGKGKSDGISVGTRRAKAKEASIGHENKSSPTGFVEESEGESALRKRREIQKERANRMICTSDTPTK